MYMYNYKMSGPTKSESETKNNMLANATLSFQNQNQNQDQIDQTNQIEEHSVEIYGMLEITAATITEISTKNIEIWMSIDISGSMEEYCKDGKTKIHHIRNITKNLIRELYKFKDTNISIIINGFETNVHHILDVNNLTHLSEQELADDVLAKIDNLIPMALTNIENALMDVKRRMDSRAQSQAVTQEQVKRIHILYTDGSATDGNQDPNYLQKLMPTNCSNITLGLGTDYDSKALRTITNNNFKHINEAEIAGKCVGEIIHLFLFETLTHIEITVQNAIIYDFTDNVWRTKLLIPSIASQQTKNYSIMSSTPDNVVVTIRYKVKDEQFEYIILENQKTDLTKYQFRQEVMILLSNASEIETQQNDVEDTNYLDEIGYLISEETQINERRSRKALIKDKIKIIKGEIKDQLVRMLRYMNEHNLNKDPFYITLCMDLKVSLESIGRKNAELFINSRLTSQGRQESYTCDTIDTEDTQPLWGHSIPRNSIPRNSRRSCMSRSNNINSYFDEEYVVLENVEEYNEEAENVEEYNEEAETLLAKFNKTIGQNMDSPYTTPQQTLLMRGLSQEDDDQSQEEEEEDDDHDSHSQSRV